LARQHNPYPTYDVSSIPPNFLRSTAVSHVEMPLCDYSALEHHQIQLRSYGHRSGLVIRKLHSLLMGALCLGYGVELAGRWDSQLVLEEAGIYCEGCDRAGDSGDGPGCGW
jgi:hypothetical protein